MVLSSAIVCDRLRSRSQDRRSVFPYDRRRSQNFLRSAIVCVYSLFNSALCILFLILHGNMQTSQEYFTTIVYANFGGQTECIMDNWKIVNGNQPLASSKRMVIWQTLRFTDKLWNKHNFEYGSSAKLFTICMKVNRSIHTSGLWVTEVVTYIRTTPLLLFLIPYMFLVTCA